MAIKHLRDGEDFSAAGGHFSRDFGFSGSAEGESGPKSASPPFAQEGPTRGPKHVAEPVEAGGGDYARGGHVHPHGDCPRGGPEAHASGGHIVHHHHGGHSIHHPDGHVTHHLHDGAEARPLAHGGEAMSHMHPHGHHVVRVEQHSDGRVIHHHSHGGHSVHHPDGHISHHHEDGTPAMAEGGGMAAVGMHSDSSTYVGGNRRDGGGEGYAMGGRTRIPRSFTPVAERHRSPIETPPRNPTKTTSPRNDMPGGQMGYGVQPSAEPDVAGSEEGIPQMKHGGRHKHREHEKA